MGPVNPRMMPIFTSSARAVPLSSALETRAKNIFLMKILRKLEKQKRLSKSVIRLPRYGNIDTLLTLREVF